MGVMIFGELVPFAEILRGLGELEREINGDAAASTGNSGMSAPR